MAVIIFALGIKSENGLVKSTINTANSLVDKNVDVNIINIVGKNGGFDFLDPAFPLNNKVKKYSLDGLGLDLVYEDNILFYEESQQFLKARYTKRHEIVLQNIERKLTHDDLIIFTHPMAMVLYFEANKKSSAKTLIQVHGNYIEEVDNFNLLKGYVDKVDYIQTVSRYMRDDLIELLGVNGNKIICIYNIVRPIAITKNRKKYEKRISIIGSIQARKNQLDAIRMLSLIEDRNVVLQIFGKPLNKEYMNLLVEQIEVRGLVDRVLFLDIASEKDIYENTELTLMPSLHEGFGYILLESAMYNIPTVTYNYKYGAKEFSQNNKNGCLIAMGDYRKMASVVTELLENDEKYSFVTKLNYDFVLDEYSEEKIVKQYMSLIGCIDNIIDFDDLITCGACLATLVEVDNIAHSIEEIEVISAWENNNINKKYNKFHSISFDLLSKIDINHFYFVYKKSKFLIKHALTKMSLKKITFSKDDRSVYANVVLQIPVKNRLSMTKDIDRFDLFVNTKSGNDLMVLSFRNNEILNKSMQEVFVKSNYKCFGNKKISAIPHILNPDGLWIKYPSFESISAIIDDKNNQLKYTSRSVKFYGKTFPFFKVENKIYKKITVITNSGRKLIIDFQSFNYEYIFNTIQELEKQNNLFDITLHGVYFWELIRATIFETILESTGVLSKHFNKNVQDKYKYTGNKNLSDVTDKKKIIFEFPRKDEIDFRTIAVQNHFKDDAIVIEYPQKHGYSDRVYDECLPVYPIEQYLNYCKNNKFPVTFKGEDKKIIRWLKSVFIKKIGLDIEFTLFISRRLTKFQQEYNYFNDYFNLKNFDELLIPSSYWSAGIVAAAKEHNILVSDIQYALISKLHPSFAFPISCRAYGADRIYLWSRYWNIKEVPFNKSIVLPTNYFSEKIKTLQIDCDNYLYDVVFVSQSRIGEVFFDMVLDYAKADSTKKIVFSPHPDEDISYYKNYRKLFDLANIELSKKDTLTTIIHSKCVVGVYSTSMFEALALKKRVFVLKLNGYEVLKKEIDRNYMTLITNINDLIDAINQVETEPNHNYAELFFGNSLQVSSSYNIKKICN